MSNPQSGQMPPDPDALLSGGGGMRNRTVSFKTLNEWKTMIVEGKETVQARDDDGKLDTWDNGDPKWVVVVTVQTDQRHPDIEDDDGIRYLWLKGSKDPAKKTLMGATIQAYEAAGCSKLEIGGELSMAWVGEGTKPSPTKNPPKFYEARFVPAADVAMRSGGSGGSNGHASAASTPAPAAQATSAPASAQNGNGGGAANGLDWSRLGHLDPQVKLQLVNMPGLDTDTVLAMYPAPANGGGLSEFEGLRREDFANLDDLRWKGVVAAHEKGVPVAKLKEMFGAAV
jgi:hypothetical protein